MISRTLQLDDFLWALDNSRRRHRVRPTRLGDLTFRFGETYPGLITVVSIKSARYMVMAARCQVSPGPWLDTDAYADFRLLAINRKRALQARGGA